ncbi:MAG: hypothetical protein M3279_07465 [Actinomycetota bacterium]|nr:hypothetical protein [Actinomycetota bacterium]
MHPLGHPLLGHVFPRQLQPPHPGNEHEHAAWADGIPQNIPNDIPATVPAIVFSPFPRALRRLIFLAKSSVM